MRRILFGFCLSFCCIMSGYAQVTSSCAQTLRLARSTYEQGRLHELPTLLNQCLNGGFTNDEKQLKVEAYKLLCMSYIYLEEPELADDIMLKLLRTDPYFRPNQQVDPAEFVALFNTFRSEPIYRIGAKIGTNYSAPNVSKSIVAVELSSDSEFKPLAAIQFGFAADIPIKSKLTLHADLIYTQSRFEIDEKVERGLDVDTGMPRLNSFTGIESHIALSLPVSIEYTFLNPDSKVHEKFQPYVSGGISTNYLLSSRITGERTRSDQTSIPESGVDVDREKINFAGVIASGIKTKIASGLLVFELKYFYGITNISTEANAYSNQKLLWDYGYANPIFKMNSIGINVSYVQDIFKPKKKAPRK